MSAAFNLLSVSRCCCGVTSVCHLCSPLTIPTTWTVVLGDITNSGCSSCASYTGTFLAAFVSNCKWVYDFGSAACGYSVDNDRIDVEVVMSFGVPSVQTTLVIQCGSGSTETIRWVEALPFSRCDPTDLACTYASHTACSPKRCSVSSPTCAVTGNGPFF